MDYAVHRDSTEPISAAGTIQRLPPAFPDEDLFRLLVESVLDYAVFALDIHGNVKSWNPGAVRQTGYAVEDALGQNVGFLYPPSAGADNSLYVDLETARCTGSYVTEGWIVRKDSTRFWAKVLITPMWARDRALCGFGVMAADITERKQAESNLRGLLDFAPDAMVVADSDGKIVLVNAQTEKRFGYRREELHGQPVEVLLPERFRELHRRHRSDFVSDPYPRAMGSGLDLYALDKAGHEIPVEVSLSPLDGESGVLIMAALRDVTTRKQTQDALARSLEAAHTQLSTSEASFRVIFEHAAVGIAMVGLDGAWIDVNRRLCKIVGYSREELLDLTFQDITYPDDQDVHKASLDEVLAGRLDTITIEKRYVRKDGALVWVHITTSLVRSMDGVPNFMISVIEDITSRRAEAETLRRAHMDLERRVAERTAELARSNEELQQFAYVASHDLQEPLRMVGSYTQLLARRYEGQLDDKADQYIAYAVDGVKRMQELIQDLLAYSRLGTQETPLSETNLDEVLSTTLANLRVAIDESGAVVTVEPLPTVLADRAQMVSLFQNLIGNAIKYRGDRPPAIRVRGRQKGRSWLFSVRDNGIGIDPQFYERIFVIFQRLHRRSEYSGTGIGLAVCKKIVDRHNGRIWVESEPGKGSIFYFTLPRL
ncbi:MAG: PAS domain S-box protein [Capsulimonadaceae bacterium]